jgi:hypothetical protein
MIADLQKLSRLIERDSFLKQTIQCKTLAEVPYQGALYPLMAFALGSKDPASPVLFLTGGVHGLEKIGAQLAWSLLKTTMDRLIWDKSLRELFRNIRLVVIPMVNPVGCSHFTRSNGHGVDLMRNSPVRAVDRVPFLLGGQRYSNKLPWYQGQEGVLELENQVLVSYFQEQTSKSRCVVAVDFHSGFGMRDRLWFPFSYTTAPFDDLPEMHALTQLFEQTHPYHVYKVEPQSNGYLLNGDIWDHLFLEFKKHTQNATFLPLTLEMGSWTWVRKNPLQLFSRQGAFNPIKEHRVKRTYRRHHLLFDFLLKAVNSHEIWSNLQTGQRDKHQRFAMERWYSRNKSVRV